MNKKVVLLTMVSFLLVAAVAYTDGREFKGYLSDVMCASAGKDPSGNNLLKNPEKHTVACMKMASCIASGYGMFIKNDQGNYVFHKFDQKGSDMAKTKILDVTKKTDNILIEVKGKLQPDGTVIVKHIESEKD
ncbi:MAG: hypothetical protein HQK56_16460 [Deltaproteobacteria bacterium]|nr:hypothetical protein [Deltaproteobacteria bacterium]